MHENLIKQFEPADSDEYNYFNQWGTNGWTGLFHLDLTLSMAIDEGASDIHLRLNEYPTFTVLGNIDKKENMVRLDDNILTDVVLGMLSHEAQGRYVKDLEYDTIYKIRMGPYKDRRFRVNIGKSFEVNQLTFRTINDNIPELSDLGIKKDITSLFDNNSGVVLVCGATGSGKSTSLASIIRDIQLKKRLKILTIEKPVEYVYPDDGLSYIVQRNIPEDCLSFSDGLTSAMRSAPNIILVGEVRDRVEVDELLRAAETGHLSVSTIHTSNNVTTLSRIRSLYAGDEQRRILSTLGDTLRGIINQTLVKSKDGKSRFAVREVLLVDFEIRKLIADDKISEIRTLQERRQETMEHKLIEAWLEEKCTKAEARLKSPDPTYFDHLVSQLEKSGLVNDNGFVRKFKESSSPIQREKNIEEPKVVKQTNPIREQEGERVAPVHEPTSVPHKKTPPKNISTAVAQFEKSINKKQSRTESFFDELL